mmetsp:Transcript_19335/g.49435  ORF Transcript_19335/g.49435 Transcript_19335/m.49435 type:complete len:85 (-) Transcript_19335:1286-1540(-)
MPQAATAQAQQMSSRQTMIAASPSTAVLAGVLCGSSTASIDKAVELAKTSEALEVVLSTPSELESVDGERWSGGCVRDVGEGGE